MRERIAKKLWEVSRDQATLSMFVKPWEETKQEVKDFYYKQADAILPEIIVVPDPKKKGKTSNPSVFEIVTEYLEGGQMIEPNKTICEIVGDYLDNNEFGCLCDVEYMECSCDRDDLMSCGEPNSGTCVAGYIVPCDQKNCEETERCDCPSDGDPKGCRSLTRKEGGDGK